MCLASGCVDGLKRCFYLVASRPALCFICQSSVLFGLFDTVSLLYKSSSLNLALKLIGISYIRFLK